MSDGRGGARAGAGRKPKELRYWPVAQNVEDKIAHALPAIIEKLIDLAKEGDVSAARYLCDRILGRTAALEAPPAYDRTMPYTDHDFEKFAKQHRPHLLDPEEDEITPSANDSAPAPRPESPDSELPSVSKAPLPASGRGRGRGFAESYHSPHDQTTPESPDSEPPSASTETVPASASGIADLPPLAGGSRGVSDSCSPLPPFPWRGEGWGERGSDEPVATSDSSAVDAQLTETPQELQEIGVNYASRDLSNRVAVLPAISGTPLPLGEGSGVRVSDNSSADTSDAPKGGDSEPQDGSPDLQPSAAAPASPARKRARQRANINIGWRERNAQLKPVSKLFR